VGVFSAVREKLEIVESIQVDGTHPIKNLQFLANINLGQKEKTVEFYLPEAIKKRRDDKYNSFRSSVFNFSIETENKLVRSIMISIKSNYYISAPKDKSILTFSPNQTKLITRLHKAQPKRSFLKLVKMMVKDPFKKQCGFRLPLEEKNGVFFAYLNVLNSLNKRVRSGRFLIDTGWSNTTFSKKFFKTLSYKEPLIDNELLVILDNQAIQIKESQSDIPPDKLFSDMKIDGVIGGDILFSRDLILNMKDEYLCIPKTSTKVLAKKLKLKSMPVVYDAQRAWFDFTVNGEKIKDYFLDTGSDQTSLLKTDIKKLKLKVLTTEERQNIDGKYKTHTYGPVKLGFMKGKPIIVSKISEAPNKRFRKIGNDVMAQYVWFIPSNQPVIYYYSW